MNTTFACFQLKFGRGWVSSPILKDAGVQECPLGGFPAEEQEELQLRPGVGQLGGLVRLGSGGPPGHGALRRGCLSSAWPGFSECMSAAPVQCYLQVSISDHGGLTGVGQTVDAEGFPVSLLLFLGPQTSWLTLCMFNSLLAVAVTCLGADN